MPSGLYVSIERGQRRPSDANLDALASVPELGLTRERLEAWRAADDIGKRHLWLLISEGKDLLIEVAAELGPPGVTWEIVQSVTPAVIADRGTAWVRENQAAIVGNADPLTPKEIEVVAQLRAIAPLHELDLGPTSFVWAYERGARLRYLKHALAEQRAAGAAPGAQEGVG